MRPKQLRSAIAPRMHSRHCPEALLAFTPEELVADETQDPHAFRVLTDFRRAHGVAKGATTLLYNSAFTQGIDSRHNGSRDK